MSSTRSDFALLLAAPDPVEADLARGLLAAAGIPSMLQEQDLGATVYLGLGVSRPDVLVPRSALGRARDLLREAWNGGELTDEMALGSPTIEEDTRRSRFASPAWIVFVGVLALVFLVTVAYSRFFGP